MLNGKFVILRDFRTEDINDIYDWANDSDTTLYSSSNPFSTAEKDMLYKQYIEKKTSRNIWAICTAGKELIGEISYWIPDERFNTTVELGAVIGKAKYRNLGYGLEAFLLLGSYIFNNPNIHRISISVSEHNHMSGIPLQNSGIVKEGVIERERHIDGKYYNSILYGILREEFYELRDSFYRMIN